MIKNLELEKQELRSEKESYGRKIEELNSEIFENGITSEIISSKEK